MLRPETDFSCGMFDSRVVLPQRDESPRRTVTFREFEFFPADTGESIVDGTHYPTRPGKVLCVPAGFERNSILPVRCYYVRLFALESEEERILSGFPLCFYTDAQTGARLCSLFSSLAECFLLPDGTERTLRANSLFLEILSVCHVFLGAHPERHAEGGSLSPVLNVKEYIESHYAEDCSLPVLAARVHLSKNHLRTLFSRQMGLSPAEYVLRCRIGAAKRAILLGEKELSVIAAECGFCSQSHLGAVFRRVVGMTPAEFRRRADGE